MYDIIILLSNKNKIMTSEHITTQPILEKEHKNPLTELPNRLWLEEHFDDIAEDNNNKVGLLFIDLDGTKDVNDADGHEEGDKYIRNGVGVVRDSVRYDHGDFRDISDFIIHGEKSEGIPKVVHRSGDEIIVLLPGVDTEQMAEDIVERIKVNSDEVGLPLSIGVAIYTPGESLEGFVDRAEKEMQVDKIRFFKKLSPEQKELIRETVDKFEKAGLHELGARALQHAFKELESDNQQL
jgi:two-component system cell cycle response regulator